MNVSAVKDLQCDWYLNMVSKLLETFGEYDLKEFLNRGVIVLIERAFIRLLIYHVTEKIANAPTFICTAVQIKN